MKRSTVITDRLACLISGGALIALGGSAVAWQLGKLPVPPGAVVRLEWLPSATTTVWWPIGLGIATVVTVLVGLRWLVSHRPGQRLGSAALPGSDGPGQLSVDVNTIASAVAADLQHHRRIVATKGTTLIDRGQRLIEVDVTVDPAADSLTAAATAIRGAQRDLAEALDGVPYTSRFLIRTTRARKGASRVQ